MKQQGGPEEKLRTRIDQAQEGLRRLAREVISAQEEERRRLSRALHDEAGQALVALKVDLELIREDLPADQVSLRRRMADAITLTDETMEQIRLLARDLHPPALDTVGLGATREDFCDEFAKRTELSIDYSGVELPPMPEEVKICLYRFVQEALTNVAKHAAASQVSVALRHSEGTIRLSVEDDGRGFDAESRLSAVGWPLGVGLEGMQERVESLGGRLELCSRPGEGTRTTAYIPLPQADREEEV